MILNLRLPVDGIQAATSGHRGELAVTPTSD